jgi:lysyl-tRNA synthetase class 2
MDMMIDETVELCRCVLGPLPVRRVSYREVFVETAGIDPFESGKDDLRGRLESTGTAIPAGLSYDELCQLVMAAVVEPAFPEATLMCVDRFPASQSALAAPDRGDSRLSLRFEVYCGRVELANGWEEIRDAAEIRLRYENENRKRRSAGREALPLDETFFLSATRHRGPVLPQCSGAALGFDRLVMCAAGRGGVGDVMPVCWEEW